MNWLTALIFLFPALIAGCSDSPEPITEAPVPDDSDRSTAAAVPPTESDPDAGANADVIFVRAVESDDGRTWTFHVTVQHPDTGWEDYADGWDVVLPNGTVVRPDAESPFTRLLRHPHEAEQPFTRSQSGIEIPSGFSSVTVRAHDLVDGFGGQEIIVDLARTSGPGFQIEHAGR